MLSYRHEGWIERALVLKEREEGLGRVKARKQYKLVICGLNTRELTRSDCGADCNR